VGDEIKDANGDYYMVKTVDLWWWLDQFSHYQCELEKRSPHALRPTTSGTWHLDSDSVKTDPRYRHKLWLDDHLTAANMKLDNGATNATVITCFDGADYPLTQVFINKDVDGVFSVGKTPVEALYSWNHYPYAFIETATIACCAVDKSGLTATNLVEQMEQEIRHIATDHPFGSLHSISRVEHNPIDIGGTVLHSSTVTIKFKRMNDDYTPAFPTFSDGIGFTYEGDRESGGAEGTWTEHDGGSTVTISVNSERNLYFNQTVFVGDSYTETETAGADLGLSTTLYPKIRFRYKTSGNATAKIRVTGAGYAQTVLAETASSTWTVGTATLTAANTLDHIYLYCCDGTGTVTYDYVQIYSGMYILPNCVSMSPPFMVNDSDTQMPMRLGTSTQALGTQSMEIRMVCDLTMEPSALTWKRPQDGTPKTDYNNMDILLETLNYGGGNAQYLWVWLDIGEPIMQFKARLKEVHPSFGGEEGLVELVWSEYRHGSALSESTVERFGLNL